MIDESLPSEKGDERLKKDETESSSTLDEIESTLTFQPPVYIQRYMTIRKILEEENCIKKMIDFGCAEFKLFKYIKELPHVEYICGVDVDENLITKCKYEARPLPFHYVLGFPHKLTVELFVGSIAEPDKRLLDADAVICIELIEHLYQDVLEKVPSTIFGFIKPKLVVFTTPNADFNVLFKLKTFRHDDHKFEWTRKEFEDWCSEILLKYPNYKVQYEGIGDGPKGTEHLGSCSQMAIFRKIKEDEMNDINVGEPYKLYDTFEYPYQPDCRSTEEKFSDDLTYRLNRIFTNRLFASEEEDFKFEIPVEYLWNFLKEFFPKIDAFLTILEEKGYTIKKKNNDEYILEIFQEEPYSESDSDEYLCESLTLKTSISEETTDEKWDDF